MRFKLRAGIYYSEHGCPYNPSIKTSWQYRYCHLLIFWFLASCRSDLQNWGSVMHCFHWNRPYDPRVGCKSRRVVEKRRENDESVMKSPTGR